MSRRIPIVLAFLLALLDAREGAGDPPAVPPAIAARVRLRDANGALGLVRALPAGKRGEPALAYLEARLLADLGRPGEAADRAARVGDGLPAGVREDLARRRARWLARSGRCAEARPALIANGASRGAEAALDRAMAAECALALGDAAEAAAELEAVVRDDGAIVDGFAARMLLFEARLATGRRADAIEAIRHAIVERPAHPEAEAALRRLESLGERLDDEDRMARAARLIDAGRPDEALAALDAMRRPRANPARARWLHLRGDALFHARRYDDAARALAESARAGGDESVGDGFLAARALARADRDREAVVALGAFARSHPTHPKAREAQYLAAWLTGRRSKAAGRNAMRRVATSADPRTDRYAAEASFQLALDALDRERPAEAVTWLASQTARDRGALATGRACYWTGRAEEARSGRDAAATAYRAAIAEEPLSWYALLAMKRLRALGVDAPAFVEAAPSTAPSPIDVSLPESARFFVAAGLVRDAAASVEAAGDALFGSVPESRRREARIRALTSVGAATEAYRLAALRPGDFRAPPSASTGWLWHAAYPRPFRRIVEREAARHGLDPDYLFATMRQESAFDADAVSPAGAVGLMQVMPHLAESLGRRLGLALAADAMFEPEWNVRLGAQEIADLVARHDGVLPLAIAAYNAGNARVARWRDETPSADLDRFVEAIPFDETRNYVRRVIGHLAHYRVLRGDAAGSLLDLLPDGLEGPVPPR